MQRSFFFPSPSSSFLLSSDLGWEISACSPPLLFGSIIDIRHHFRFKWHLLGVKLSYTQLSLL